MNHHPIRKHRRSVAEIGALLHRYRQSQLTQVQFVKQEGICLATLARYLRREKSTSQPTKPQGFVEIAPVNARLPIGRSEPFKVSLRQDISVEIHPGFCAGELARLLAVLNGMDAQ